jgi:hypothetical protein
MVLTLEGGARKGAGEVEPTGPLADAGDALLRLLVQAVGAVLMVRLGWDGLKIVAGGNVEREFKRLLLQLLAIGVLLWCLANPAQTVGLARDLGGAVAGAVAEALRGQGAR